MKHNRLVLACVCGSLGLVTALLGVAGFAGIRALDEQDRSFQLVTENYVIKEAVGGVLTDIRALRTAQRTYVQDNGIEAVVQFEEAHARLRGDLNRLWAIPHSPEQLDRVTRLTAMLGERYDEFRTIIDLHAMGDGEGAMREMNSSRGAGQTTALTRLAEKFAQADSSDSRAKSGTGLGLSITKAIVEKMSGLIGFDTKPGGGTTFYVDFPEAPARTSADRRTQWGERLRDAS